MNRKPYQSIHHKLIHILSICLIVPMLIYCCYSYQATRNRLGRDYQERAIDTMEATAQSINSYMGIADYTARSLHFNADILPLLALNGQKLSPSRQLDITNKLFDYMQQLYGVIPDASQIHIDAYKLRRILLLTNTFQQYEKEHIYVWSERKVTTKPYETYVLPTHLQYDYNFTNTELNSYSLVITLTLPIYDIPSTDEILGKLSIDIPIEVFAQMCAPLYEAEEDFYILDSDHNIIFSSDSALTGTLCQNNDLILLAHQASQAGDTIIEDASEELHFCVPLEDSPLNWYLIKSTPKSYVYRDANLFFRQSLTILLLSIIAALSFSFLAIIRQTRPLRQLTKFTDAIQKGNLDEHLSDYIVYTENDEIGSLIQSIQKMMYSINHFIIREYQLELANKSSELKALQAQINPHFIYNTLQCIAAESLETNNLEVYRSITTLGHMMQYSMDTRHNCVELQQEITNCINYIKLQKMRFSTAQVELKLENTPESLSLPVPKMILQPLVENAFKHGNLLKIPDSRILIRSYIADGILHIFVEDNGIGIRFDIQQQVQEQLKRTKAELSNQGAQTFIHYFNQAEETARQSEHSFRLENDLKNARKNLHISNHIGLCNVYMRLLLMYDSQCSLSIYANEDCGTTIHIEIIMNAIEPFQTRPETPDT